MPDIFLVEPRSEHRGGPKVPTAVDRGRAIFSDQTLRFVGAKTVTWRWRNFLGMQAGRDFLIFSVSNRQMASGIGADESEQWAVEIATNWALAAHDGGSLDPVHAALGLPAAPGWDPPDPEARILSGDNAAAGGVDTRRSPRESRGGGTPQQPSDIQARPAEIEATAEDCELRPYVSWDVNAPLPPPDSARPHEVRESLMRIIDVEGPVLGGRLYALYATSAGISRVGPNIRRILDRESKVLERKGSIVVDDPLHEGDYWSAASFRLPEQPVYEVRELGERTLHQVPPAELAALMATLRNLPYEKDALFRGVLNTYGLSRLTQTTSERLRRCLSLVNGSP